MPRKKVTVSLDPDLVEDLRALAKEMGTTRDTLFSSALSAYLYRHGSSKLLLKRINAACDIEPDPEEEAWRRAALHYHMRHLEKEDWSPKRRS